MNMRTRAQTRFNRGNTPLPAPLAQARPAGPPTAKPRPDATSAPKCRTTTRSARKRKAQADKIPPLIIEYLNSVHPTQWSFDDAKAYMKVEGLGTKIKWELKAKLEEIVNSSNDGERCQAAIRVLQKLNSHRAFSTPAATFRVNSGTSSTIIYAPGSSGTIINGTIPPSTTVASTTYIGDTQNDSIGLQGSPAYSDSSNPKYGPSDVTSFVSIYSTLRTRFELHTHKRSTSLEELLFNYIRNKPTENDDILLQAGFLDLAKEPRLVSSEELSIIKSVLHTQLNDNPDHDIIACIKICFRNCQTFENFARARDKFMCANCKYTPLFEQASSAVLYTVHLLQNDVSLPYPPLEGNFDIIWGQVIDRAFISHHGILYRKEKASSLSPYKFDGLYLSEGSIIPQEWLVLEVSRSSNQGTKQINDRQKLLQHCLRILNHRRSYLSSQTNLQGVELMISLRKFPVWGILCQGFAIEIVKLGWVTRGVGLVSTFVSKYPTHIAKVQNLYRILEQVHMVVGLIQTAVTAWDELHESMEGN